MIVTKPFFRISLLEGTTLWNFKITEYFTPLEYSESQNRQLCMWSLAPVAKQKDVHLGTDASSLVPAHVILNVFILCWTIAASPGHTGQRIPFASPTQLCWSVWTLPDPGSGEITASAGETVSCFPNSVFRFCAVSSQLSHFPQSLIASCQIWNASTSCLHLEPVKQWL